MYTLLLLTLVVSCQGYRQLSSRSVFVPVLSRNGGVTQTKLWAEEEMTKGESGTKGEGELMLERNRRDLWKEISSLEKEAVGILKSSSGSEEELKEKKVEAFKLFSKSVGLKKRDSFQQLAKEYGNAEEGGDSEGIQIVLSKMREMGLPPHIASLVDAKRKKLNELERQEPNAKESTRDKEDNTPVVIEQVAREACESETVTEKIRVKVHTFFDKESSDVEMGQYMFWYKVAIYNEGSEPVQIVARMWEIEKLPNMEKEILRGTGVLQTQPIISPGDVFAYESKCPIKCFPVKGKRLLASMGGAFTACRGNMGQHNFPVKVSKVNFVLPESDCV